MGNDSRLSLLMSAVDRECTVDMLVDWLALEGCPEEILEALMGWASGPIVTAERWRQWTKAVEADKGWIATVRGY